jgi:hypothetical protein
MHFEKLEDRQVLAADDLAVSITGLRDGQEPGSNATDKGQFLVQLKDPQGAPSIIPVGSTTKGSLTFKYSTAGITATQGSDFGAPSGTLTIPEGSSTGVINIDVIDNAVVEAVESLSVTLTSIEDNGTPIAALVGPNQAGRIIMIAPTKSATINIIDNDAATFTVSAVTVNENVGNAPVTLSLNNAIDIPITIDVTFVDQTATGGGIDYVSTKQSFTFNALDSAPKTILVPIINDNLPEPTELFYVRAFSSTSLGGRNVTFGSGGVAIQDGDPPRLEIESVKVGSSGWLPAFNNFIDPTGPSGQQGYAIPTGAAQDDTLPWLNIDRIYVKFSMDLDLSTVTGNNIVLNSANASPGVNAALLSFNQFSRILTIPLLGPIKNDRLRLEIKDTVKSTTGEFLDGEFNNNVQSFNSGDGTPGASFQFRFNVLPGDATHSTITDFLATPQPITDLVDLTTAYASFNTTAGSTAVGPNGSAYSIFRDVNGSGGVDLNDISGIFSRNGQLLPGAPLPGGLPSILGGSTGTDENENEKEPWVTDAASVSVETSRSNDVIVDDIDSYNSLRVDAVFGSLDTESNGPDEFSLSLDASNERLIYPFDDLTA